MNINVSEGIAWYRSLGFSAVSRGDGACIGGLSGLPLLSPYSAVFNTIDCPTYYCTTSKGGRRHSWRLNPHPRIEVQYIINNSVLPRSLQTLIRCRRSKTRGTKKGHINITSLPNCGTQFIRSPETDSPAPILRRAGAVHPTPLPPLISDRPDQFGVTLDTCRARRLRLDFFF